MKERLFHVKYEKNYLTHVIFQLRFAPVRELTEREMESYYEQVKDLLPDMKLLQRMSLTATVSPQEPPSVATEKAQPVWVLHTKDQSNVLTVAAEQFTLECKKYEDIDALDRVFHALWSKFQSVYPVAVLTRVGLRYINQIVLPTGNALEWTGWLSEEVVAAALKFPTPATLGLARSMHVAIWQGDNHGVRFQWGISNSDFPNTITKKEFTLDYDCYTVGEVEASDARKLLGQYNGIIDDLFDKSIAGKLKDEMGIIEDQTAVAEGGEAR